MTYRPNSEADTGSSAFAAAQSTAATAGVEERMYATRVRQLYSGTSLAVGINVTIALILAVVQRNVVDQAVLLGWFAFMSASVLWRVWLAKRFKTAAPADDDTLVWARRYMLATAWTGIAWGTAGIFMLPESSPPHQVVTAFVLGGMAAGAMVMLARIYVVYLVFVIPALTPVSLHFIWLGGETGYAMAITSALFLLFLLHAGRLQSVVLGQSLRLAMDNEGLVNHLTEEKARAEQLNSELRHEMAEREKVAGDLREREASLASAQRIAGLGSWEWNAKTNAVKYSDEGYRIFGLDSNNPSSYQEAMDRIPEEDRKKIEARIQHAFETGDPYSVEHRLMHPDLGERIILERAQVVRSGDGEIAGLVGTAHDITEQNHILRELEEARQLAEDGSRAKSRFLANMSHEFRTPLNAIIGYSEILKEDAIAAGQHDSAGDLGRVNAAGQHLLALVNEVLDLSKIEAGRMELLVESFEVEELVGELVSTARPLATVQGNELTADCGPDLGEMVADATKVRQILYNLLSNAAKFTEGGRITVTARRLEETGPEGHAGWIQFTVTDNGIGMAKDQIEVAFRAFDQLDPSTTRKFGGTGLGLAISRHYCEMMGGEISAESEPGEGSRFFVRLPAQASDCRPAKVVEAGE